MRPPGCRWAHPSAAALRGCDDDDPCDAADGVPGSDLRDLRDRLGHHRVMRVGPLFGLIAAIGVQQLAKADLTSDRNLFIAGFSLFMGLSVPAYFAAKGSTEGLQVGQMLALYRPTAEGLLASLPPTLAGILVSVGSTGMAVAAIFGIVLDNLVPGSPEERGLGPSLLVPEARDVGVGE